MTAPRESPPRVAVAYSGGRDSTALLHATLSAARSGAFEVVALHVHHGLHPDADQWLRHCASTCRRWARDGVALSFASHRLEGPPPAGESIEAWAREGRYRALAAMARDHGVGAVLLAHHQRDQAETLLLQALRGGGVAGLAAMPRSVERDGITWLRPWLAVSHEAIAAYVRQHRLRHIHDGSNDDPRYARNRLRRDVWPALAAAFPQAEQALATTAGWAQQAVDLLAEAAREDLARIVGLRGLRRSAWRALSPARGANALRAWIGDVSGHAAPASLMRRLANELPQATAARWPVGGGELRLHRGLLSFHVDARPRAPSEPVADLVSIRRAGRYRLPGWHGLLLATRVEEGGIALSRVQGLRVAVRSGGESFQLGPGRPPRALKKQYQALDVPRWQRDGPLLYDGETLVFVAGLGIDARTLAPAGEPQLALQWLPEESLPGPG